MSTGRLGRQVRGRESSHLLRRHVTSACLCCLTGLVHQSYGVGSAMCCAKSLQLCSSLCDPMDCSPLGSSVHEILQARILGCHALLQGNLPNPGTELRSPTLQADSLPSESPGKPKNTRMGCHFLLQGIFPVQGLNPHLLGPLHCQACLFVCLFVLPLAPLGEPMG